LKLSKNSAENDKAANYSNEIVVLIPLLGRNKPSHTVYLAGWSIFFADKTEVGACIRDWSSNNQPQQHEANHRGEGLVGGRFFKPLNNVDH